MNCREARELLFAFLDNELDAALSLEMQRHLEHCPACAREAEIERTIGKHLAAALDRQGDTPVLNEQQLQASLASDRGPISVGKRWRLRRWAIAGCAIVLLGAGAALISVRLGHRAVISRDALVDDFDDFVAHGRPVQIASDDRQRVADWVGRELDVRVELPAMHGHCKLVGARKCNSAGRPGALVLYDVDGQPASVLVLSGVRLDFKGMTRAADSAHWVDRCKGHTIVASQEDGVTYAAVAQLPQSQLLELVPAGQSDLSGRE